MATVTWNQSLFLLLNHWTQALPDWLWSSITITGHTSIVFALFGVFLLPKWKRPDLITGLFVTAILGGVVSTMVKEAFKIPRPPAVLAPDQFHLIGHKLELVSFPSGHTLTAFAVAALLIFGLDLHRWRLLFTLVFACAIGLSRIAVGAHWPLDVLGGAVLGICCGWVGWRTAMYIHLTQGGVHVLYLSTQAFIILGASMSLFATSMGYPDAQLWQSIASVLGIYFSSYGLLLLLRSVNKVRDKP